MNRGNVTIPFVLLAAFYAAFSIWMIGRLHTPVSVTFADLTEYADEEAQPKRLASHPYLKWTGEKVDKVLQNVILHDDRAAWPGYNLFTDDKQHVLLMDMDGKVVHAWRVPDYHWSEYAVVKPNGDALVVCVEDGLVQLDRYSRKVWEYRALVHHDVAEDIDGNLIVLAAGARAYKGKPVQFDFMEFLTADGKFVKRWSTYENLKTLQPLHGPAPVDLGKMPNDYYHLNSIQVLPDTPLGRKDERFKRGNYLLCLRNVNLVVVLDRDMKPVWHWGETILDLPHMPRMLPIGTILVFDNGRGRGYSRIVEVDPVTEKIVWEYRADPPESFFSPWRGSSQRLPNGNTLICSSERGRVFEVTREGKIVWEFWSPIFNEKGQRRRIYRFARLSPDEVELFLTSAREGGAFMGGPIRWEMIVLLGLPIVLLGLAVPLWRRMRAAGKAAA